MLDPYKLILVNTILISFLISLVFILRRYKRIEILTLIFASFLPVISLLRKGVNESGDFAINISKAIDLYNSLSYGIFPVHWASILNATYGYPLFLFTYPLPYYSIAFLKLTGFSFIASEKIVIALAFIASGFGMYLLLKTFLKPTNSLLGAVLYLYAPYHLVDMHFRVALGEVFAFTFLPFSFYFLICLSKKATKQYFILFTMAVSCLILSHQAIALVTFPFLMVVPFFLKVKKNNLAIIYSPLVLSLLATSFYWLPVIDGLQYTHQRTYAKSVSFENFNLYFISPWRYGFLYQGPIGQLSFPAGFVQFGLLIFGFYCLLRKKVKKYSSLLKIILTLLVFLYFMLTPTSIFFWRYIPFMSNFQFAYRLMLPVAFLLATFGAVISTRINSRALIFTMIFLAMGQTILNWGTRSMISDIDDQNLIGRVVYATSEGEGLQPAAPVWRNIENIWMKNPPKNQLQIVRGEGVISLLSKTPITHEYLVTISKPSEMVENTYYFPGWKLYINNKPYKFSYIDHSKSNLIRFYLDKGFYKIVLKYEMTPIIKFSNILSISTILSLLGYLLLYPHKLK